MFQIRNHFGILKIYHFEFSSFDCLSEYDFARYEMNECISNHDTSLYMFTMFTIDSIDIPIIQDSIIAYCDYESDCINMKSIISFSRYECIELNDRSLTSEIRKLDGNDYMFFSSYLDENCHDTILLGEGYLLDKCLNEFGLSRKLVRTEEDIRSLLVKKEIFSDSNCQNLKNDMISIMLLN